MAVSSTNAATATSVLDVPSLVSGLMQVENLALTKIDNKISAVNTRVSALGSFMSKASTLKDALDSLADPTAFTSRSATSSNSALVTVTATAVAAAATLAVQVRQTALTQQTLVSGFGSASALVSGVAGSFNLTNTATGVAVALPITTTTTLGDLATAITASTAGGTASVVQQSDSSWGLLLTSKVVGTAQAFSTDFTPTGGVAGSLAGTTTSTPQAATDAAIRVNGINYTRSSNTFAGILPGVTLTLKQPVSAADWASASTASIGVSSSNANAAGAVNRLVTAYNDAYALYKSLTRNNPSAALRGPLAGDQTLHNFMARVRALVDGGINDAAGNNVRFYNAGITTQDDGTLIVDSTQLQTALDGTLGNILASGGRVGPATGTENLKSFVRTALLAGGLLAGGQSSGKSQVDTLNTQRDTMSDRLVRVRARYTAQYARLDAQLTTMQQSSTALAGALDALTAQTRANNK
jgi:flagellar hook-associated protein 2